MKCPKCNNELREVEVRIQDADSPITSYQCIDCGYFDFEEKSINRAIEEIKLKETTLKIRQKIIKLSRDRLGMYFNRDVVRSLNLRGGEDIDVSIPDNKHIIIGLEEKDAKK